MTNEPLPYLIVCPSDRHQSKPGLVVTAPLAREILRRAAQLPLTPAARGGPAPERISIWHEVQTLGLPINLSNVTLTVVAGGDLQLRLSGMDPSTWPSPRPRSTESATIELAPLQVLAAADQTPPAQDAVIIPDNHGVQAGRLRLGDRQVDWFCGFERTRDSDVLYADSISCTGPCQDTLVRLIGPRTLVITHEVSDFGYYEEYLGAVLLSDDDLARIDDISAINRVRRTEWDAFYAATERRRQTEQDDLQRHVQAQAAAAELARQHAAERLRPRSRPKRS